MYIIAYILKISERIFKILKVVTCKENWVAEGRGDFIPCLQFEFFMKWMYYLF